MLAVAIACYKRYATLDRAIESVLRHGDGVVSRIILGLNGADENARAKARRLLRVGESRIALNFLFSAPTIPVGGNYSFAPFVASEPFFAMLGADDYWSSGHAGPIVERLRRDPGLAGVAPRIVYGQGAGQKRSPANALPFDQAKPGERLAAFFAQPSDNPSFYGVFRTAALRQCVHSNTSAITGAEVHALDWLIVARLLQLGPIEHSDALTLAREETPWQNYSLGVLKDDRLPAILRSFPVLEMSVQFILETRGPARSVVMRRLFELNLRKYAEVLQLAGLTPQAVEARLPAAQKILLRVFQAAIARRPFGQRRVWTQPAEIAAILRLA